MQQLKKRELAYIALILIGIGASIYFLAPALVRLQTPGDATPVITAANEFPPVRVIILTSTNCKTLCYTQRIEGRLRDLLENVQVSTVFVESQAGRDLATQYNLSLVPAYLVSKPDLLASPALGLASPYLASLDGNYYVLDTLDTKSGFLFYNNASVNRSIELYVSPFDFNSIKTENSTFTILQRFNNSINFTMHYYVNNTGGVYSGISGSADLFETVLHNCMWRLNSTHASSAIWCRARDLLSCYENGAALAFCGSNWGYCTGSWGYDYEQLSSCVRANNRTVLDQEVEASRGIKAVPTMYIDNRYVVIGLISPIELLSHVCAIYPSPACNIA